MSTGQEQDKNRYVQVQLVDPQPANVCGSSVVVGGNVQERVEGTTVYCMQPYGHNVHVTPHEARLLRSGAWVEVRWGRVHQDGTP